MQKYNNNTQVEATQPMNILPQHSARVEAIDGKALSAHLKKLRKSDLKLCRNVDSFKSIPKSLYLNLSTLGRGKYRDIVVATYMSLLWDGWSSKKKRKRIPNNKVMITKRMLHQDFDIGQSTAGKAIYDLVEHKIVIVAKKSVFSGKQGKNLGTLYRLPWMEESKGIKLHIYWGLIVSKPFLGLSVTLQAVIILLHQLHSRRKNRLTIQPCALSDYSIHRNRLPEYIEQLMQAGLLYYIENQDYEFAWFDKDGNPDFNRLKL